MSTPNPFDQFDGAAPPANGAAHAANPFDQFDVRTPVVMAPDVNPAAIAAKTVGNDLLGAVETAGTGIVNTPHAAISAVDNLLQHAGGVEHPQPTSALEVTPTPRAQEFMGAVGSSPLVQNPVSQYVGSKVGEFEAAHPVVSDVAKDAAALLPATGAVGEAEGLANSIRSNVARTLPTLKDTPEDLDAALQAVGYKSLPSQNPTAGVASRMAGKVVGENPLAQHQSLTNQAVTDALSAHEGGVPVGTPISRQALVAAAKAGPAKVYEAAEAALPAKMTQDPELQTGISAIGDTVSQLPRSPDVEGLKQSMLAQPDMTRRQLFANVQQARQRAAIYMASEDPDKNAIGRAYLQLANHYEGFIGRQLEANPNSPVSLQDFQGARTAFAKNYAVQAGLRGPDATTIDAGRIARQAAQNPGELTGGLRLVAAQHARYPLSTNYGPTTLAEGGIGRSGDLPGILGRQIGGGALAASLARMFHLPEGLGFGAGMLGSSLAMNRLRGILAGSPEAAGRVAAGAATNPRLASYFVSDADAALPPGWNRSPPSIRGLLPAPATVNAGGGATTATTLADELGLSPDVQAAGPLHPGAARLSAPQPSLFDDLVPGRAPETIQGPPGRSPARTELFPTAGLTLRPEEDAALSQRFPEGDIPYHDLLTAMAPEEGGEPLVARGAEGPAALNARRRIGGPEGVSPGQNNASGESAASLEAINRGTQPIDEVNPAGVGSPVLRDVTQVDRTPSPGNIFVNRSTGEIVHRGQLNQRLAEGLRNRYLAMRALGMSLQPDIEF